MRSLKALVGVVILAIFTLTSFALAQEKGVAETPPFGIINFSKDSHIMYGFIPGKIYSVKAEWPNDKKDKWYILAFEVNGGKIGEEPYISSSPTRLPALSRIYDGTITVNAGGAILLHSTKTGENTPLIELK
jgi:hypothetical protein